MTQMLIRGLSHCPEQKGAVLLLEDLERRLQLAFLVPMNEANRLARTLGASRCPCVPVFELVEGLLGLFEGRIRRVVLDGAEAGISSTLYVAHADGEAALPCHPADAMALATRTAAPIYATDEALRHAHPILALLPSDEVTGWLENVKPEDFEG